MSIPTQNEMFGVVLEVMRDNVSRSRKQAKEAVRDYLSLSEEECESRTTSGVPVYESRVGWSISYLSQAHLIDRVSRGVYKINAAGEELAARNLTSASLSHEISRIIDETNPWNTGSDSIETKGEPAESNQLILAVKSPQEQIGELAVEMNSALGDELLALIMDRPPAFFEKIVVELLEHMGYGKGTVTAPTNDGGIDGLITTDELGFRPICTQAKRYAIDNKVGRPELQAFAGALNGAPNGVFITTSSFTQDAVDFAKDYRSSTIALIDGKRLVNLMIKYGLGVSTESVVEIKRIDSDYFLDE